MIKSAITPILATILITTTGSYAIAGQIKGRQYVIGSSGPVASADNTITYIPCAPQYSKCINIQNMIKKNINTSYDDPQYEQIRKDWDYAVFEVLNIKKNSMARKIKTDFEGKFSFNCPTQNCLVFSQKLFDKYPKSKKYTPDTFCHWILLVSEGQQNDLSESKAICK